MAPQLLEPGKSLGMVPGWLSKGFWAVVDQGLFSVSNFAVNILLANWLPSKADYGAFTVAYSYFLLLGVFHSAFLTEPALLFGPARSGSRLKTYLGSLLYGHGLITILGGAALIGGGMFYRSYSSDPQTGSTMIALGFAAPLVLLLWLMRRTCYIESQPQRAAVGSATYFVSTIASLAVIQYTLHLSSSSAVIAMTWCSLLASLFLLIREKPVLPEVADPLLRGIRADHWRYGRWAIVTGLAIYIPSQIYFPILERISDLDAVATLRALTNLVTPSQQANLALSVLLVPMLVRARNTPRFNQIVRMALLVLAGVPLLVWPLLGLFGQRVLKLIYHDRFNGDATLVWLIGLQPVLTGACCVFYAALQSYRLPKYISYSSAAAAFTSLTVGVALMRRYGVKGAAVALLIGFAVSTLFSAYFCWQHVWGGRTQSSKESTADELVPVEIAST